jgi:cyclic beta-1,2-glucan glucanotransferase
MTSDQSLRDPPGRARRRVGPQVELEEPILAELFSVERLEQHARTLAAADRITEASREGRAVGPRIADNGRVLLESYRVLARAIMDERWVTPASEWLVDNFPIVDEQLREIRDDLPPDYYRELPKLAAGHLAGYPRVLGVAWAYIAHTDSRFDPESLRRMVLAYQEVEPLTIGELWAIAISLRILLVDNLRRLAERIVRGRTARQQADELADGVLGLGPDGPGGAAAAMRRLAKATLPTAARVELFQRLRDQDPAVTPALLWLEDLLARQGTTAEEMVRLEHQRQAAMNVTVRNVITSMRLISWFDWAQFVESVSLVDAVLRERSSFGAMDFATRDRYRHAVEELARDSGLTELEIARRAADMADADAPTSPTPLSTPPSTGSEERPPPRREPGHYLISHGRIAFERSLGVQVPRPVRFRRRYVFLASRGYVASIAIVTALLAAVPLGLSALAGPAGVGLVVVALLALAPASDLAVALVNRSVTGVLGPRRLPRLDLDAGVPTELRTLVVVPMLLTSEADAEAQVNGLEVHYLANREGDLRFALLSDWLDAPTEHVAGDDDLLSAAAAGIDRLNERHGEAPGGGARFLLFHRRRTWNDVDRLWMGWERKRGKLQELNALLRGSTTTSILVTGRPSSVPPPGVRYAVTLDADTRLPRGAVGHLVATMAHPLNEAVFDPAAGRVTRGYGVLQPRITSTLPAEHEASLYQRIFSGGAGIDPYASAVSDVYQDLYGEGSFTGKGIYDIDAFSAALADRVPDNTMLSHDLFEGVFARAGLVTDVELFDEFPSNYLVAAARQHRWTRGDWQLLPWVIGRARDATGRRRSGLPGIARWKMVDNLRRSLSAPLTIATLLAAWTLPGVSPGPWTAFVLIVLIVPQAMPVLAGILPRRQGISKRSHLRAVGADVTLAVAQVGLGLTLLAHQAWLMVDAIVRTLARLLVTRRKLLEWTTAAQAKARHDLDLAGFYRQMAGGVAIAVLAGALVLIARPGAAWVATPFIGLWLLSPLIARWVSLPPRESVAEQLSDKDTTALRLTARRTWRFFETFVTAEEHALPPDNYQDDPEPVVAHRTSPTNIGMYLLATVTARDLGWIGTLEMVERLEATLATVTGLERFRGHLYNWYDTRDLHRLEPAYVSSVDSGNFVGHLLTLANACRQMIDQPLPVAAALTGIGDAMTLTREAAASIGDERRTQTLGRRHLDEALAPPAVGADVPLTAQAWADRLGELAEHARTLSDVVATLTAERGEVAGGELVTWAEATRLAVSSHVRDLALLRPVVGTRSLPTLAELADLPDDSGGSVAPGGEGALALVRRLGAIAEQAQQIFHETDFGFLFDPTRKLFSIGFRVRDGALDTSYYDNLASEARLTSFLAIAKGDVAADHWFRLGRALTPVGRGSALISWSGSMFEYLMPALVMRTPALSLLDSTYRLIVARQMSYAAERGVPWGISESGFNARDLEQTYQYSSFGVPGLGLKRGLSEDLVVAPYATALAAMIQPEAAVRNFARLREAGGAGAYGFREALDYTPRRLPEGASVAVVKSYMAHHQGMALVAIGNVLSDRAMVERFHADPIVEATELLLQERMPRDVLVARPRAEEVKSAADVRDLVPPVLRRFTSPHDAIPRTHILSNGRYAVMVTAAGSGYSRWRDIAVTRWREDVTRDTWGSYLFLRDMQTGVVWSAGHQPSGVEADDYEVIYSEDHAEFLRRDGSITTGLTIVVSTEHDAEIRRVSLTNLGSQAREIELTSYAEIALAPQAADAAHPAFQNLFVQTEFVPEIGALLATRRPRSSDEQPIWAAHVAAVEEEHGAVVQYETDRARFLGRGRSVRSPVSVIDGRPLSNTVGAVLDPIFSLRYRLRLAPGATTHAIFSTVVADSRAEVLDLADKYREPATFERAATLAWTQAQVQLHHLGIEPDEAHLFQRLANRILYSDPSLRPSPGLLARNDRGAPGLWVHGISGDLPIVIVRIDQAEDLDIVRQLLRAHEYWRLKLVDVDLVILNEEGVSYAQDLNDLLATVVRTSQSILVDEGHPGHGGVFIIRGDRLSTEDRTLLQSAARAVLLSRRGSLADQVIRLERPKRIAPPIPAPDKRPIRAEPPAPRPELEFFNGLGGFAQDGREYVAILGPGQSTPAPWLNVIANPSFGFLVSESGSGYTWSENSRENQLTPWSNDPVGDPISEAIYIRDEDTGELWSPTAQPIRLDESTYVARHAAGYTRFEHLHDGIDLDLVQFVPPDAPLKVSVLTIENRSGRTRRLSVTAYAEWAMGTSRAASGPRIITSVDPETGAILVRNPWNTEFPGRVAFLDLGGQQTDWTADRTEFLGRNGAPDRPAGLARGHKLLRAVGAGMDPCAALQTSIELADGARSWVIVSLGEAADASGVGDLVRRGRAPDHDVTLRALATQWDDIQGTVQVRTPDRSMDIMLNGWLVYQTLACRLWARTAFYQAGGAYGFRDQLQDVIALVTTRRDLAREQLLRAAAHQFVEGDVQHWWHPPSGRGVRTRISDDRVWLPYVVDRYLAVTGDASVLDEAVPYLEGAELRADQTDAYFQPEHSSEAASLFDHCAAALDRSLAVGAHGLPLIGSGDWNDGMNRVGYLGRGESVWLGWFLYTTLAAFAPLAEARGQAARAEPWRAHMKDLRKALERHGWDGDWYRRAFFDDGTPLGSAVNLECRIDSIAQSWAVLSGAADPVHAERAMASVEEFLIRRGDGLVLLFTPPFDHSDVDPGYIKGYVPGIRENGGQYTHGAIWSVLAFAALGDGDRAGDLFSILNPINHASTRAGVQRYKVEPYVMAADVYTEPPHVGRGGWTWYTGSAGWMYQAGIESILGFRLRGTSLTIDPCIPRAWPSYTIVFRYRSARYEIGVENPHGVSRGVASAELDGQALALTGQGAAIPLADDGATHRVRVVLG